MKKKILIASVLISALFIIYFSRNIILNMVFKAKDEKFLTQSENATASNGDEDYYNQKVKNCENITRFSYKNSITFDSGATTYYLKSFCYQYAASSLRDEKLCNNVIERKSIFYDGRRVSKNECIKYVEILKKMDDENLSSPRTLDPKNIHKIYSVSSIKISPRNYLVYVVESGTVAGDYEFSILLEKNGNVLGQLFPTKKIHFGEKAEVIKDTPVNNPEFIVRRQDIEKIIGLMDSTNNTYIIKANLKLIKDDKGLLEKSNFSSEQFESSKEGNLYF